MLSALTAQELPTVWEKIVQPAVFGAIAESMPVALVNNPALPQFAVANGQFLLARRDAYEGLGGTPVRGRDRGGRPLRPAGQGARLALLAERRAGAGGDPHVHLAGGAYGRAGRRTSTPGCASCPGSSPRGRCLIVVLLAPYAGLWLAWRAGARWPWRRLAARRVSAGARLVDRTFGVPPRSPWPSPLARWPS